MAFNEDTHRLIAKGRVVPVLVECLKATCDETACELNFKDFRDKDVCDHSAALLRNLSHNAAQHNLLKASGCVEVLLNVMAKRVGAVRINSACTVAILLCFCFAKDLVIFLEAPVASEGCLLYTSPSPRDRTRSRMPSSA